MHEQLQVLPTMTKDVQLYRTIYHYAITLGQYIEQQHGLESGEGLKDIQDTLTAGLGTDHAKIWLLTHGLSEDHFGLQVAADEAIKIVGKPYHTYMHGIGLSLLQGCYREFLQDEIIVKAMSTGLYRYRDGTKQIPRIITYVKARRSIRDAIEHENLIDIMSTFYPSQYVDEFCQWYRVGKYENEKSVGLGGTGKVNASIGIAHIVAVETLVENILSGEFGIPLDNQYSIDFSGYSRKKKYLEKYRISTAERKKSYQLFLILSRMYANRDNLALTPLQKDVLELWLSEALNGNMLRIDSTGYVSVEATIRERYPNVKMSAHRVHGIINGLSGSMPDLKLATKIMSRRIRMQQALKNADEKNDIAVRTKNLWTDVEYIMNEYHHGTTMGALAESKKYPKGFVTRLRIAMEIIMGKKSLDKIPHQDVYDYFTSFWPKEKADTLPEKIKLILTLFANKGLTAIEIAKEIGGGFEERHVDTLISYILGEIPKRIDKRLLNGYRKKYYLEKISQENLQDLLHSPWFQHCNKDDLYVFRLSTETISPPGEKGVLFTTANHLAEILKVESHKVSLTIRNVMHACENYFGPIPDEEMKRIIELSSY